MTHRLIDTTRDRIFKNIHGNNLVYNACWEDPRIDRQLLALDRSSRVVMLTSAGCNALDYLLDGPAEIHTVDMNPRQNALLQLKLALIARGEFADLFAMFGQGAHAEFRRVYRTLRAQLPSYAREFWDVKIKYFDIKGLKKSFYYRGSSGAFAWTLHQALRTAKGFRRHVYDFLDATSLDEQATLYAKIEPALWNAFSRWLLKRHAVLAMVGVPRPQLALIDAQHPESLTGFLRASLRRVATELPIGENYFWRVYVKGSYSRNCCPNYLREEHFAALRANSWRIQSYTSTLTAFLRQHPSPYSHYVLLDHQDWLAWQQPEALREEWEQILANSQAGTRVLFRSASTSTNWLPEFVRERLRFFPEQTEGLHGLDRVGTYGSLHFAEVL
jgi:S-adenosylmethionine-diacylglycerol 3-amino-3-carboxypropyl transferase